MRGYHSLHLATHPKPIHHSSPKGLQERRPRESLGGLGRGREQTPPRIPTTTPRAQPTIYMTPDARSPGPVARGAQRNRTVRWAPPARALALALPLALSRPPPSPQAGPEYCQSRPARSRPPSAGSERELTPRAQHSRRQHPGRRRRRRLPGPRPLGPRPGRAG